MIECSGCGEVFPDDDDELIGTFIGCWWFCPTCYEDIEL